RYAPITSSASLVCKEETANVSSVNPKDKEALHFGATARRRFIKDKLITKCLKLRTKVAIIISEAPAPTAIILAPINWLAPAKTNTLIIVNSNKERPDCLANTPYVIAIGKYPSIIGKPTAIPLLIILAVWLDFSLVTLTFSFKYVSLLIRKFKLL